MKLALFGLLLVLCSNAFTVSAVLIDGNQFWVLSFPGLLICATGLVMAFVGAFR